MLALSGFRLRDISSLSDGHSVATEGSSILAKPDTVIISGRFPVVLRLLAA